MASSRTISLANGIEMFVREQGEGPLVVLCHGWPELSYSWRHQIPALAAAGFRVVAPDMRGFGQTSAPAEIDAYSIFDNVGDMVALVAALGEKQAIMSATTGARRSPGTPRCFGPIFSRALPASACRRRSAAAAGRSILLRESGITNFYWQYFQTPGVAEAEFERDVDLTMRTVLGRGISDPAAICTFVQKARDFWANLDRGRPLPDWLSEADIAHFAEAYTKSGFRGGLNWYRNLDRNWELTAPWQGAQIHQPSLFIAGSKDSVITGLIGAKRVDEHGARAAESDGKNHHRGRRPLGAAGAPRRGQRRADRFSEVTLDRLSRARGRPANPSARAGRSAHRRSAESAKRWSAS